MNDNIGFLKYGDAVKFMRRKGYSYKYYLPAYIEITSGVGYGVAYYEGQPGVFGTISQAMGRWVCSIDLPRPEEVKEPTDE